MVFGLMLFLPSYTYALLVSVTFTSQQDIFVTLNLQSCHLSCVLTKECCKCVLKSCSAHQVGKTYEALRDLNPTNDLLPHQLGLLLCQSDVPLLYLRTVTVPYTRA